MHHPSSRPHGKMHETTSYHHYVVLVVAFYYETVIKHFSGCPITILRGPPESGKSTFLLAFLCNSSYYVKGTNAFFIDWSSESTLAYYRIDDPLSSTLSNTNLLDVRELIVNLYNGAKSANALKDPKGLVQLLLLPQTLTWRTIPSKHSLLVSSSKNNTPQTCWHYF